MAWDPVLLWLWCRRAAVALIQLLAWEPPYASGAKKKKKKKKDLFTLLPRPSCILALIHISHFPRPFPAPSSKGNSLTVAAPQSSALCVYSLKTISLQSLLIQSYRFFCFCFIFFNLIDWSRVDSQCSVHFRCTSK